MLITISTQLRTFAMAAGFDADLLSLALWHIQEAENFPVIGAAADRRLKIYLDLKDWIALAKARLGRPGSKADQPVYEDLRARAAAGEVLVPLTASTYYEIAKISQLRQRADLTAVIAEISGFVTVTGTSVATSHQIRSALAVRHGRPQPDPLAPFGIGVFFAFGDSRRLTLTSKDGKRPDIPIQLIRELVTTGRAATEFMFLQGPKPEEIEALRAIGYRPEAVLTNHAKRVAHEQELADMVAKDPTMRPRLGDIVYARHIAWELLDYVKKIAPEFGMTPEEFFDHGKDWLTAFIDDVPSAAVTVTLMERNFRNSYKTWTGNDLYDADAMAAAIPYCDVVMADKHVAAQLAKSSAVRCQGTLVLSKLVDLHQRLPALIAARAVA
jgi:hypothetical protein